MRFNDMVATTAHRNHSLLCIGLDPDPARIPSRFAGEKDPIAAFCAAMIDATADLVCAFKPNSAFFEALGPRGGETLHRVIACVPDGVPVILDAKRGDIGNTAAAYARAAFDELGAHAITLNPYLGGDALQPFLDYADRGCILLCKTSNPGSADLQDLSLANGRPLYLEVARRAQTSWNHNHNVALVVGATFPAELRAVRDQCPDLPFLIPGIGAQGGDIAATVAAALDARREGVIISASRSVLFASAGDDAAVAARREARALRDAINVARER